MRPPGASRSALRPERSAPPRSPGCARGPVLPRGRCARGRGRRSCCRGRALRARLSGRASAAPRAESRTGGAGKGREGRLRALLEAAAAGLPCACLARSLSALSGCKGLREPVRRIRALCRRPAELCLAAAPGLWEQSLALTGARCRWKTPISCTARPRVLRAFFWLLGG